MAIGIGISISSYFVSNATPQEHTSNKAWNNPSNGDANGMFQVYYKNDHGVRGDDVTLAQDLYALAELDFDCFNLRE